MEWFVHGRNEKFWKEVFLKLLLEGLFMDIENPLFKCFLTRGSSNQELFALHFNQAIPKLEGFLQGGMFAEKCGPLSSSPRKRAAIARRLAVINQGRIVTELTQPGRVFSVFIEELNQIKGIVSIQNRSPYRLDYQAGLLFDAIEIGKLMAKALHTHFFGEQEFLFSVSRDFGVSLPESDPEKTLQHKAKNIMVEPQ